MYSKYKHQDVCFHCFNTPSSFNFIAASVICKFSIKPFVPQVQKVALFKFISFYRHYCMFNKHDNKLLEDASISVANSIENDLFYNYDIMIFNLNGKESKNILNKFILNL